MTTVPVTPPPEGRRSAALVTSGIEDADGLAACAPLLSGRPASAR
jgi:hypothetical protein